MCLFSRISIASTPDNELLSPPNNASPLNGVSTRVSEIDIYQSPPIGNMNNSSEINSDCSAEGFPHKLEKRMQSWSKEKTFKFDGNTLGGRKSNRNANKQMQTPSEHDKNGMTSLPNLWCSFLSYFVSISRSFK